MSAIYKPFRPKSIPVMFFLVISQALVIIGSLITFFICAKVESNFLSNLSQRKTLSSYYSKTFTGFKIDHNNLISGTLIEDPVIYPVLFHFDYFSDGKL